MSGPARPRWDAGLPDDVRRVVLAVAEHHGWNRWPEAVIGVGVGRPGSSVWARQEAMWILREHTSYSDEEIGDFFGGRHAQTVRHAVKVVDETFAAYEAAGLTVGADRFERLVLSLYPDAGIDYDRVWHWRKRLGDRKGQMCRIVCRGTMNSILVEFDDGYRVVTSAWGVRRQVVTL